MAVTKSPTASLPAPNVALTPLPVGERQFRWRDHAALWLSLGVGLLVIQVGSFLMPALGTQTALLVIVAGSILGAGLLGWTAKLACDTGLSSAGLMHATFGSGFARLPVVLNLVQLVGWTSFEVVVMRDGTAAIARTSLGWGYAALPVIATLLWGALLVLLLSMSMVGIVRRLISRFALPLVVASLLWLSWQFLHRADNMGLAALWNRTGSGGMGTLAALDLVLAMPVSWLPLVADFARHGRSGKSAMGGTWCGYALANVWCYALGVLVALTAPSEDLVAALLLAQGGLIAFGLILVDEIDNAYGDLYAGAMAGHSLRPRWTLRHWGIALAVVSTALALVLPMHALEPFLLMLSSVFVPLYAVILARLVGRPAAAVAATTAGAAVQAPAIAVWLLGVACYHLCAQFAPDWGAALPTLVLTFVLARMLPMHQQSTR